MSTLIYRTAACGLRDGLSTPRPLSKVGLWTRLLSATAVAVLALASPSRATAAPEVTDVTVYSSLDVQAPVQLITALRQGYFKQVGLNVTPKWYQAASDVPAGMLGGSIVLAHGGMVNPLIVADQGFPVKVIAMVADYQRSSQIVVSKAIANLSPADLAGKTLVATDVPAMRLFWQNWTAANKIDPKTIRWLNTAPSDGVVAFNSGRADMLLSWAPHTTNAVEAGGVLWQDGMYSYRSGKPVESPVYNNWGVVFGSADWIRKYPNTVKAYLSALYMAQAYLECNPDEVSKVVSAENRVDPKQGAAMMKLNTYEVVMSKQFLGEVQNWTDYFHKAGILKRPLATRDLVDPSLMEAVAKTTPVPACKK